MEDWVRLIAPDRLAAFLQGALGAPGPLVVEGRSLSGNSNITAFIRFAYIRSTSGGMIWSWAPARKTTGAWIWPTERLARSIMATRPYRVSARAPQSSSGSRPMLRSSSILSEG